MIQHRHSTTILRPAGNVVANRNRSLLAVGDRAHALPGHTARHQILTRGLRAAGAERDIVFASTALIGVALDGKVVTAVVVEPLRLLIQRGAGLRCQLR